MRDVLLAASKQNDRSINSEIVARLRSSLLPEEVSRIRWSLDHANHGEYAKTGQLTVSMLAEKAGEKSPARLEAIMNGLERPTFELLDTLTAVLNVDADWLKHGIGNPLDS